MKKLIAKVFIKGKIIAETGLHIGGSKASLDIGGVDSNVVKTPQGVPFIPGSSLKGKLRSLLAKLQGSIAVSAKDLSEKDKITRNSKSQADKNTNPQNREQASEQPKPSILIDEDFPYLLQLFGSSSDERGDDKGEVTRLLVRDARLDTTHFEETFTDKDAELDSDYTDVKWENTINRKKGTAQHPRQLERVPAEAQFDFELVYDLYDDATNDYEPSTTEKSVSKLPPATLGKSKLDTHFWALKTAMKLLQDDYLGGQGSRGYGKVRFEVEKVHQKSINVSGVYAGCELDKTIAAYNFKECFPELLDEPVNTQR